MPLVCHEIASLLNGGMLTHLQQCGRLVFRNFVFKLIAAEADGQSFDSEKSMGVGLAYSDGALGIIAEVALREKTRTLHAGFPTIVGD